MEYIPRPHPVHDRDCSVVLTDRGSVAFYGKDHHIEALIFCAAMAKHKLDMATPVPAITPMLTPV